MTLTWDAPTNRPPRYAVYRTRSAAPPDLDAASQDASNLLVVTGDTSVVDYPGVAADPYYYWVRSVSSNSVESSRLCLSFYTGGPRRPECRTEVAAHLSSYPNPFTDGTHIEFVLPVEGEVTLRIFNAIGAEVNVLVDKRFWAQACTDTSGKDRVQPDSA